MTTTSIVLESVQTSGDISLEALPQPQLKGDSYLGSQQGKQDLREGQGIFDPENATPRDEENTPPANAVGARYTWKSPPINKYRVLATYWSFFVGGMNDGSYGALIPHIEEDFNLNYTVVSLIFLSPFAGYAMASAVNNLVHVNLGQRGVGCLGPLFHLIPYTIMTFHTPYPVLVVVYIFVGVGNGLTDAAFNAWIGNMANSHEVTGILHMCYALGATVAPLIATAMITQAKMGWWSYFYVMIGTSAVELIICSTTFWSQTAAVYLAENPHTQQEKSGGKSGRTRQALKNKLTWIFSLFIFLYNGAEVSVGGWIVVFMTTVRGSSSFAGGATATGFWGGMTAGRVLLSFVTSRLGEFRAVLLYLTAAIALELVFWLVPNMVVSAVAAALFGFVTGPMYPAAVVLMTKLLPRSLHVGTIGFATAVGGSGSAIVPFAVGAIAQARGVQALQPIILAVCIMLAALWTLIHHIGRKNKKGEDENPEHEA